MCVLFVTVYLKVGQHVQPLSRWRIIIVFLLSLARPPTALLNALLAEPSSKRSHFSITSFCGSFSPIKTIVSTQHPPFLCDSTKRRLDLNYIQSNNKLVFCYMYASDHNLFRVAKTRQIKLTHTKLNQCIDCLTSNQKALLIKAFK